MIVKCDLHPEERYAVIKILKPQKEPIRLLLKISFRCKLYREALAAAAGTAGVRIVKVKTLAV